MELDLVALAIPMTRRQALEQFLVVDCTSVAAFNGFNQPCAVSVHVWDAVVGCRDAVPTRAETAGAIDRLAKLWLVAARAVNAKAQALQTRTVGRVEFHFPDVAGRPVNLRLTCTHDRLDGPVVTIDLDQGE